MSLSPVSTALTNAIGSSWEPIQKAIEGFSKRRDIGGSFKFVKKLFDNSIVKDNLILNGLIPISKAGLAKELYTQKTILTRIEKALFEEPKAEDLSVEVVENSEDARLSLIQLKAVLGKFNKQTIIGNSDVEAVADITVRVVNNLKMHIDIKEESKSNELAKLKQAYSAGFFKTASLTYLWKVISTHMKYAFDYGLEKDITHLKKRLKYVKATEKTARTIAKK